MTLLAIAAISGSVAFLVADFYNFCTTAKSDTTQGV